MVIEKIKKDIKHKAAFLGGTAFNHHIKSETDDDWDDEDESGGGGLNKNPIADAMREDLFKSF